MIGYIYLRLNQWFIQKNVVKLGETENVNDRNSTYITGEPDKGEFIKIYEVDNSKNVEYKLKQYLSNDHYNGDGGTEFFHYCIIDKIESAMLELNIKYKLVTIDQTPSPKRTPLTQIPPNYLNIVSYNSIQLRSYQQETYDKAIEYYKNHNKGIINWCCGLGKTIISLYLSILYLTNYLLIGLNSLDLIEQWETEIQKFYNLPILKISSKDVNNIESIKNWFDKNKTGIIIISYQSSFKLKKLNIEYDFAIFDECHHLTGNIVDTSDNRRNISILDLNIKKQLGLTATIKEIETNDKHIDNLDEKYFGKIIDTRSVLWAITNKFITDYNLLTPKISKEELEDMIESNKIKGVTENDYYLYLSAYLSLRSIESDNRKKILIYANKIEDMKKIYEYIKLIHEKMFPELYVPFIHYTDVSLNILKERFNSYEVGILVNVYKVGEGIDIPTLDTVLFSDNMGSSTRITQSCLRPNRLDPNNKDKVANIIIPLIYEEDANFMHEDGDLKIKLFPTIMRIIEELSVSDENILNRVKSTKIVKKPKKPKDPKTIFDVCEDIQIEKQIKLRTIKRNLLGKKTFPYMKKMINQMGGRTDLNLSLEEDYRNNKQFKNGLPDVEWVRDYIHRNNDKTWFDLYQIDTSKYVSWDEFVRVWKEYEEKKYTPSDIYPPYSDLEELYGCYGYKALSFWDKYDEYEH